MPPPRPRGLGFSTGVSSARQNSNTPMSERQQMALLIQMTANSELSRSHLKKNEHKKCEEMEEILSHEKQEILQEMRGDKAEHILENKHDITSGHGNISEQVGVSNQLKRSLSDIDEEDYEDIDDVKKKKRKDSDSKDNKAVQNIRLPTRVEKNVKQSSVAKGSHIVSKTLISLEKESVDNSKAFGKVTSDNDTEEEEFKMSENIYGGLKVPPLKIVIPQQNCSIDTDGNLSRTGKINTSRSAALPYVVSSNNEAVERDLNAQCNSPHESPIKINTICPTIDEKNMKLINEEKNLQRVLRSSHRVGTACLERSSNNSSPQMQSSSPSPASLNVNDNIENKISFNNNTSSPFQSSHNYENENITNLLSPSTSSTSSSKEVQSNTAELHPRKRKIRSKNDESHLKGNPVNNSIDSSANLLDTHPHDFPFTNCFQMYLNIRKQIEKKWRNVFAVKPRPPQGYHEYILNKRSYLLAENEKKININIPTTVSPKMREIFSIQEKERYELYIRHSVEREKLCLNVEQEILRVHSKAARNISYQSLPFSVCSFLKDAEVYNIITPEQEEKDRNARHRFNGRLLLSWLQDVDDKWEKIKDSMVLRHHNEAESLHAVQLMDWEIALKKFELCDYKIKIFVERNHVPIVNVSDDFDLLPA